MTIPGSNEPTMDRTVVYETIGQPCWAAVGWALRAIAAVDRRGLLKATPSMKAWTSGWARRARFNGDTGANQAISARGEAAFRRWTVRTASPASWAIWVNDSPSSAW